MAFSIEGEMMPRVIFAVISVLGMTAPWIHIRRCYLGIDENGFREFCWTRRLDMAWDSVIRFQIAEVGEGRTIGIILSDASKTSKLMTVLADGNDAYLQNNYGSQLAEILNILKEYRRSRCTANSASALTRAASSRDL